MFWTALLLSLNDFFSLCQLVRLFDSIHLFKFPLGCLGKVALVSNVLQATGPFLIIRYLKIQLSKTTPRIGIETARLFIEINGDEILL